jgi:23S rRNA pseudouridine1911/1915/1917 synthase
MQIIHIANAEKGKRLDHVLATLLSDVSRTKLQRMIEQGIIVVDGQKVAAHHFLRGGETVIIGEATSAQTTVVAPLPTIPVVAKATDYLVIEKPSGIAVHPGAGVRPPTLVDALLVQFPEIKGVGDRYRPGIVHRLDKDVSGLMIIARTTRGYDFFTDAFREKQMHKTYIALVHGDIAQDAGTIDRVIARSSRRARMAARAPGQEGKEAVTHWRVEKRFRNATKLAVTIETGRTHQIRAHLFSIGHPVVGDPLYRVPRFKLRGAPARPFLHAAALSFVDPEGKTCAFESSLPPPLADFLKDLPQANAPVFHRKSVEKVYEGRDDSVS